MSRRSLVVAVDAEASTDRLARARVESLDRAGIEATYLGRAQSARRIATAVVDEHATAVELCLARGGGVLLLRELLRELIRAGRRDVSIVVHRAARS